ncbi:unnamed protein product [Ilex paraguariensis]|uniref:Malectin-like domain-containing protein n=2 Tax=Ilex paraguariensis TaxID=185542 RepID=A0ABC8SQC4_9AQUA
MSSFSNITWRFEVRENATHLVRVHFCDIVSRTLNFSIFNFYIFSKFDQLINPYHTFPQLVVPFYYDFVVDTDDSGFLNVSIGLRNDSKHQSAFLNGLEIMQLIKEVGSAPKTTEPTTKHWRMIVRSVVGGVAVILILVMVVLFGLKYSKITQQSSRGSPLPNLNLGLKVSFADLLSEPGHGQGLPEFQTEIMVVLKIHHRHLVSSIGYCDKRSEMILKSDVYSFEVVLLEVFCARPAIRSLLLRDQVNLADWGMSWQKKGQLEKIVDPFLEDKINPNSLRKFGETVKKCLMDCGIGRPGMIDVLWDLEYALQLNQTTVLREPYEDRTIDASLELSLHVVNRLPSNSITMDEDEWTLGAIDGSDTNFLNAGVFSQLKVDDAR